MNYWLKFYSCSGIISFLFVTFSSWNILTAQTQKIDPGMLTLPFEKSLNQTVTNEEAIAFIHNLDRSDNRFKVYTKGQTDAELPLHIGVLSADNCRNGDAARASGRIVIFINNGIHPGEPEGIDATLAFFRDLLQKDHLDDILRDVVLVMVPVYNIEGCLNRNSYSRANQDGPESYGFRGNGQNYDLNRDFIKADSRNARSFAALFQEWQPDIFIDNHTSNGADYSYTMTLLTTQHNKLGGTKGAFLNEIFLRDVYAAMSVAGWPMCPYVNTEGGLQNGIFGFNDNPRYSSGYASLFGAIAFLPETHMLKPFKERLLSNYALMDEVLKLSVKYKAQLITLRQSHLQYYLDADTYPLNWKTDKSKKDTFLFHGYEAEKIPSKITGHERTYYNREKPYQRELPFYNYSKPSLEVDIPAYYVVPKAYHEVLERLRENQVDMYRLTEALEKPVLQYKIEDFKSTAHPYEGHYLHHSIQVSSHKKARTLDAGDYIIPTAQFAIRYIMETLEPQADDSFFAWNYFDAILSRKEWFSDYVFEDIAAELLEQDADLKKRFLEKKSDDPKFAENAYAQLQFIYENSDYSEPGFRMYPVLKVDQEIPSKFLKKVSAGN